MLPAFYIALDCTENYSSCKLTFLIALYYNIACVAIEYVTFFCQKNFPTKVELTLKDCKLQYIIILFLDFDMLKKTTANG